MADSSLSYLYNWWSYVSPLWYNYQEYVGAMMIWERAIEAL
jgi:hypothetical protein